MAIVDRDAREALLVMLERALSRVESAELPEQTMMPGGATMALMSRARSDYGDGSPALFMMNLTVVAENESDLETIVARVREMAGG